MREIRLLQVSGDPPRRSPDKRRPERRVQRPGPTDDPDLVDTDRRAPTSPLDASETLNVRV